MIIIIFASTKKINMPIKKKKVKVPEETNAEKYKREYEEELAKKSREERAYRSLQAFKRKDLVRECIIRGLPFEHVGEGTPYLASYFTNNLDNGQDFTRLGEYDAWIEGELRKKGHLDDNRVLLHPSLKFGMVGKSEDWDFKSLLKIPNKNPEQKSRTKIPNKNPEQKSRIVKNDQGLRSGTKKALTYELTQKGWKLDEIIEAVEEKYPDAKEASITIWHKRCLKELKS